MLGLVGNHEDSIVAHVMFLGKCASNSSHVSEHRFRSYLLTVYTCDTTKFLTAQIDAMSYHEEMIL